MQSRFPCITGFNLVDIGERSEEMSSHQSVPLGQVLLYRGCPLIRVSLEDRFYCIEGVLSSECPLKSGFTA